MTVIHVTYEDGCFEKKESLGTKLMLYTIHSVCACVCVFVCRHMNMECPCSSGLMYTTSGIPTLPSLLRDT